MMYGDSLVDQFLSIKVRGTINKLIIYVVMTIGSLYIISG